MRLCSKHAVNTNSLIKPLSIASPSSQCSLSVPRHHFRPESASYNPFDKRHPNYATTGQFLSNIITGNKAWAQENYVESDDLGGGQNPITTLLSCCDSRVPASALGTTAPNKIFTVTNIGNQFINSIGSFRYGLEVLKTPYAIIMGHTNCGAIRAAASDYRYLHTMVQQEVLSLVRVIRFADSLANSSILDEMPFDMRCNVYSEINVDYQIMQLLDDWQISSRVHDGKLNIIGVMFDVHNIYNSGYGRLHIVNINGDRDTLSLKQNPLYQQVNDGSNGNYSNDELQDSVVSRLFSYSASQVQFSQNAGV